MLGKQAAQVMQVSGKCLFNLKLKLERAAASSVAQFCSHELFLSTSCRSVFLGCQFCSLNSHIICDAFLQQHLLKAFL